jgi:hypothetical protein
VAAAAAAAELRGPSSTTSRAGGRVAYAPRGRDLGGLRREGGSGFGFGVGGELGRAEGYYRRSDRPPYLTGGLNFFPEMEE